MGLRVGGLISGIDTERLIESVLTLERRPLDLAQQRRAVLELEQSLFRDLNGLVDDLRNAAAAIDNLSTGLLGPSLEEELLAYTATSSDESVLVATGSSGATPGVVTVGVNALATAARYGTTAVAGDTDIIANPGETLTLDAGGANPITITVGAAGASLVDLRSAINTDPNNTGEVRADVIDDGSGFRLVISGTQTGAVNDITLSTTITNGGGQLFDPMIYRPATDTNLDVFGINVTRPSTTIDDLIPGVTLELHSTSTTDVEVNVELDDSAISSKLQDFADAYNAILDFVSDQSDVDADTELAGPLSGDSTLRSIQNALQRSVIKRLTLPNNPFESLSDVGIKLDDEGRLSVDDAVLSSALAQDPNAIRELLTGDATTPGLALGLLNQIDVLTETDPTDPQLVGLFEARNDGYQRLIDAMDTQIERLEFRLEKREELLVLQFSQLETLLGSLQSQGSALSSLQTFNNNNN